MPDTATHPTDEAIEAFALGKLDPAAAAGVEEHLADCPACQDRVEAVTPDTLVQLLASAKTVADAGRSAVPTLTFAGDFTPSLAPTHAWDGTPHDTDGAKPPAVLASHAKYRVVRRIGVGGMGAVWLAEHTVMNRPVAVKVIRPDLLARPGATARFLREVRAAAKLHHPNIVTAFDAEAVGDSCLLVMEYVDGETLADRAKRGPMPAAEACRSARDAARGLAAAHKAGLVHRDVKPHNLIRAADGTTKVLDFGLAGVAAGEVIAASGETLTGAGAVCGTPDYIPPEQITDPHGADARADIYGLGCTLHHLLAGRVAFPGGTVSDKLAAQVSRSPDPIPGLAPDLAAILAKMLAKRPEDRYQTADEVAAALEPFCRSEPAPAADRPGSRRWLAVAAGMLFAALAVAAGVVIKVQYDNKEIVVTTNDPDVEVVMKRKGEVLRVVDKKTGQVWEIDAATNQIAQADREDGLTLALPENEAVILKRQGKEVFRVARTPKPAGGPEPVPVKPAPVNVAPVSLEPLHRIPWGNHGSFNDCDVSPDGKYALAVALGSGTVRVWDAATGKQLHEWPDANMAGFTADSRHVHVANSTLRKKKNIDQFRVYNVETGELVRQFPFGPLSNDCELSADGSRLLRTLQGGAEVWDFATGKKLCAVPFTFGDAIRLTPDGRHFLRQEGGKPPLLVYDAATGEPSDAHAVLRNLPPLGTWWPTLANMSADGRRILAADGKTLKVFDTANGKAVTSIAVPESWGLLSADGRLVFGSAAERTAAGVWDAATGGQVATLKFPELMDAKQMSRTSRDGRTTVFALPSGIVYVFRLPGGAAAKTP